MKPQPTTKQIWILTAMIFLLYVLLIPKNFFGVDGSYWTDWTTYLHSHKISEAYNNTSINYPPLYLYMLKVFSAPFNSTEKLLKYLYHTKIISLAFDFITVVLALRWLLLWHIQPLNILFLLLNIAFIYNSLIWWQIDTIYTAFVFLAITSLFFSRQYLAILFFILAIYTKPTALIYLPTFLVLLIPYLVTSPMRFLWLLLFSFFVQIILLSPFIAAGSLNDVIQNALLKRVDLYSVASMKAYNFWYLFLDENPRNVNDGVLAFNLVSYRTLGLIMFVVAFVAALFPLLKLTLQKLNAKTVFHEKEFGFIFLTLGLLTLVAFFFPTRIHERYAHAGVLFFFLHACYTGNFKLYILYSIAYFINLEKEAQFLLMPNEVDEFLKPEYVAVIYLLIGAAAFKKLYAKPSAA